MQVAQTCQLALQRMHYLAEHTEPAQQAFRTIDPAPAAPEDTPTAQLREQLLDERAPIFERYQALFALRNQVRQAPSCSMRLLAVDNAWDQLCTSKVWGQLLNVCSCRTQQNP